MTSAVRGLLKPPGMEPSCPNPPNGLEDSVGVESEKSMFEEAEEERRLLLLTRCLFFGAPDFISQKRMHREDDRRDWEYQREMGMNQGSERFRVLSLSLSLSLMEMKEESNGL